MKYFCCSDIHGDYEALMRAVIANEYNPNNKNHQLVVCGDCFGRAMTKSTDSLDVFRYLTNKIHTNPPIVLRGNHEDILHNMIDRGWATDIDNYNGEVATVYSLSGLELGLPHEEYIRVAEKNTNINDWICKLPFVLKTKTHILVHGWFPINYLADLVDGVQRNIDEDEWVHATWSKTITKVRVFMYDYPHGLGKRIVFGHWHASDFYRIFNGVDGVTDHIWIDEKHNLVALDCCTARSHNLEMYVFEE